MGLLSVLWPVILIATCVSLHLDVNHAESAHHAAKTVADDMLNGFYEGYRNPESIGVFSVPYYWWQWGAAWAALVDFYRLTGDESYNDLAVQSILAHKGESNNMLPIAFMSSQGNDDQAFWAFAALSAAETASFPSPPPGNPSYLELAQTVFHEQMGRWDTANCGGGLRWQIYGSHHSWMYKNSISNGAFFLLAARLARFTGDQLYVDWAEKVWNWMEESSFLLSDYTVFDGAHTNTDCTDFNEDQWTYNTAILLAGSAYLYSYTGDDLYEDRMKKLLASCNKKFYIDSIAHEPACEPYGICTNDGCSFKGFMQRWLGITYQLVPGLQDEIRPLIMGTAKGAAQACSGGPQGTLCGNKWVGYDGGFDGIHKFSTELAAIEAIQASLIDRAADIFSLESGGTHDKVIRIANELKREKENRHKRFNDELEKGIEKRRRSKKSKKEKNGACHGSVQSRWAFAVMILAICKILTS